MSGRRCEISRTGAVPVRNVKSQESFIIPAYIKHNLDVWTVVCRFQEHTCVWSPTSLDVHHESTFECMPSRGDEQATHRPRSEASVASRLRQIPQQPVRHE